MRRSVAAALCAAFLAVSAQAGIGVEANGARADDRWGGELGVGYRLKLAGFSLTPGAGVLVYANKDSRYDSQTLSNGNKVCRDTTNGQFADKEKCGARVRAYGRIEAAYMIPRFATVGAGARISNKVRPYGLVSLPLAPLVAIKGNAGPKYYALGITVGY